MAHSSVRAHPDIGKRTLSIDLAPGDDPVVVGVDRIQQRGAAERLSREYLLRPEYEVRFR